MRALSVNLDFKSPALGVKVSSCTLIRLALLNKEFIRVQLILGDGRNDNFARESEKTKTHDSVKLVC